MRGIVSNAKTYIGIEVVCGKKMLTKEEVEDHRYGIFSDDNSITSLAEFRFPIFC